MKKLNYHFFNNRKINHYAYEIYHYTSPDGLKGILESNSLHFTHTYFLNDKSELVYTYVLILEILPNLKNKLDEELYKVLFDRAEYVTSSNYFNHESSVLFREEFYVASFSQDSDNLSLWNNYTKSNDKTGYNLKFVSNDLIETIRKRLPESFVEASSVCYDKNKQKEALIDCINFYNEQLKTSNSKSEILHCLIYELIVYSLFFKHPKFVNENEYRIIISNYAHINDKNLEFRIRNGLFIPYISCKLPDKTDVKNRIIEEIKISPIADKELVKYSLNKLLNKTGYHFLTLSYSSIPLRF